MNSWHIHCGPCEEILIFPYHPRSFLSMLLIWVSCCLRNFWFSGSLSLLCVYVLCSILWVHTLTFWHIQLCKYMFYYSDIRLWILLLLNWSNRDKIRLVELDIYKSLSHNFHVIHFMMSLCHLILSTLVIINGLSCDLCNENCFGFVCECNQWMILLNMLKAYNDKF